MTKKNLTRKHLTNKIYQNLGFSKNFSSTLVDDFFEAIINELIKTDKIKISSFGTFKVVSKNERIGRNPKNKIAAKISARRIVKFKPSTLFKEKINRQ